MNILIIDGQGGRVGAQLTAAVLEKLPDSTLTAVGTNSTATAAMKKAGAEYAATGENSVIVCCRDADVIIGPIGIVIADSMLGEITPAMAAAVGRSRAKKLLIPMNLCSNIVVGMPSMTIAAMINTAIELLEKMKNA